MDNSAQIYKSLCAIQQEIGAIGKDQQNTQQGFMFRGIDQVMNTLHPLLAKNGVVVMPEIIDTKREERQTSRGGTLIYTIHTVRFHLVAEDGSEVCSVVVGEGMDSADKSSNKAMAAAYKYMAFQVFCIPTEEMAMADPDNYGVPTVAPSAERDNLIKKIEACDTEAKLGQLWKSTGNKYLGDKDMLARFGAKRKELTGKE